MIYLIQVTCYTAILYMVYLLFLKNRTDHNWSRAYLLMNMTLPFVLPLISMPVFERGNETVTAITLPLITVGTELSEKASGINILPAMYIAVSSLLIGYFIAQAVQIALFIKRHPAEKQDDIWLITNTGMGPGSWFKYVFIPATHADSAILAHEKAHARYQHSYDILLMRLVQCVIWPNVVLFFIAKELKTVHEFQADAVAGTNKIQYGETLLNELFHTKHFSLSHTFAHHPIKRRIMMLQKNRANAGKMKVVTLSLLLVTGMLYLQCSKDEERAKKIAKKETPIVASTTEQKAPPTPQPEQKNDAPKKTVKAPVAKNDNPVKNWDDPAQRAADSLRIAKKLYGGGLKVKRISGLGSPSLKNAYDVAPQFNGDLMDFMQKNLEYPKAAKENKIEGEVMVVFDVNEQGDVENIEVLNPFDPSLTQPSLDIVKKMPKWTPGMKNGKPVKVKFHLPVNYKLK